MHQNMSTTDRLLRILLAAAVASVLLSRGLSGPALLAGLLVALVLLLTGAVGYCPLYALLGICTHRPRPR